MYNRRDQIGHWVRKKEPVYRPCHHACCRGYMVNAKGRARGIDPDEILTGRQAVFDRYASDEAKDYFAVNSRPTAAYFRGRDTRYVERASEPKRRRRGLVTR